MLRSYVLDFGGSWDKHLPLMEFVYDNSFQESIQMASSEALYGRRCQSPIRQFEAGDTKVLDKDLVKSMHDKLKLIRKILLVAQSRKKAYLYKGH